MNANSLNQDSLESCLDRIQDQAWCAALLDALPPIDPAPAKRLALRQRILERTRAPGIKSSLTIRSTEGEWALNAPRVFMKTLVDDEDGRSFLLRLEPGAVVAAHDHEDDEECLVLEGSVSIADLTLHAGDYHLAPRGLPHGQMKSATGALLFIRSGRSMIHSYA